MIKSKKFIGLVVVLGLGLSISCARNKKHRKSPSADADKVVVTDGDKGDKSATEEANKIKVAVSGHPSAIDFELDTLDGKVVVTGLQLANSVYVSKKGSGPIKNGLINVLEALPEEQLKIKIKLIPQAGPGTLRVEFPKIRIVKGAYVVKATDIHSIDYSEEQTPTGKYEKGTVAKIRDVVGKYVSRSNLDLETGHFLFFSEQGGDGGSYEENPLQNYVAYLNEAAPKTTKDALYIDKNMKIHFLKVVGESIIDRSDSALELKLVEKVSLTLKESFGTYSLKEFFEEALAKGKFHRKGGREQSIKAESKIEEVMHTSTAPVDKTKQVKVENDYVPQSSSSSYSKDSAEKNGEKFGQNGLERDQVGTSKVAKDSKDADETFVQVNEENATIEASETIEQKNSTNKTMKSSIAEDASEKKKAERQKLREKSKTAKDDSKQNQDADESETSIWGDIKNVLSLLLPRKR